MQQIKKNDIRRAAMDLLARREHGNRELHNKLLLRFSKVKDAFEHGEFELEETIAEEIARLQSEGLQSDTRMAEAFIRARANRGQGPVKIKAELRNKGLDESTISLTIENCGIDWFSAIKDVASKRFGDESLDLKSRARRNRFLQQRGFTFDHINTLV